MPETPERIYWDSCLFLAYVNEEPGRVDVVSDLLASSSTGELTVYTSDLSRVEVAFATLEREQKVLSRDIEARIDRLWEGEVAMTVEFNAAIARLARSFIRQAVTVGRSLKPYDATHLATAQWLSDNGIHIDQFHTFETRLDWLNGREGVGFRILRPYTPTPRLI